MDWNNWIKTTKSSETCMFIFKHDVMLMIVDNKGKKNETIVKKDALYNVEGIFSHYHFIFSPLFFIISLTFSSIQCPAISLFQLSR